MNELNEIIDGRTLTLFRLALKMNELNEIIDGRILMLFACH